ncbi:MAG TPA: acetylglutamate kinase [Candidatus Paceibacterota bacterium]|nr:acetylglutamate kinase [Candidatus Paceibacterota bacterium]
MDKKIIKKADVLIEALPYIQKFYEKIIVIKYGGAAMTDKEVRKNVLKDIVFMNYVGMRPVLVHGGGPNITKKIEQMGGEVKFVDGFRVTDKITIGVVEEELLQINKELVQEITSLGGTAISLSGKDDNLIEVKKHPPINGEDIGFVGEITKINGDVIQRMLTSDIIPVIPPLGIGASDGLTYNINADNVAAEIAGALGAIKFVLITNVAGIISAGGGSASGGKNSGTLISRASKTDVKKLIKSGVVSGGMIPKVNACVRALDCGVAKTHIINEKIPHALLLEIFTDEGIGTEIVKK